MQKLKNLHIFIILSGHVVLNAAIQAAQDQNDNRANHHYSRNIEYHRNTSQRSPPQIIAMQVINRPSKIPDAARRLSLSLLFIVTIAPFVVFADPDTMSAQHDQDANDGKPDALERNHYPFGRGGEIDNPVCDFVIAHKRADHEHHK
jgi:hypothetical protein